VRPPSQLTWTCGQSRMVPTRASCSLDFFCFREAPLPLTDDHDLGNSALIVVAGMAVDQVILNFQFCLWTNCNIMWFTLPMSIVTPIEPSQSVISHALIWCTQMTSQLAKVWCFVAGSGNVSQTQQVRPAPTNGSATLQPSDQT
jgi:hypothetical protein